MLWKNEQEKRPRGNNTVEKKRLGNGAEGGRIKNVESLRSKGWEKRKKRWWISNCYMPHDTQLAVPLPCESPTPGHDPPGCPRDSAPMWHSPSQWARGSPWSCQQQRQLCVHPTTTGSRSPLHPLPCCLHSLWDIGNRSKYIKDKHTNKQT